MKIIFALIINLIKSHIEEDLFLERVHLARECALIIEQHTSRSMGRDKIIQQVYISFKIHKPFKKKLKISSFSFRFVSKKIGTLCCLHIYKASKTIMFSKEKQGL
jgi:hypothetical protein